MRTRHRADRVQLLLVLQVAVAGVLIAAILAASTALEASRPGTISQAAPLLIAPRPATPQPAVPQSDTPESSASLFSAARPSGARAVTVTSPDRSLPSFAAAAPAPDPDHPKPVRDATAPPPAATTTTTNPRTPGACLRATHQLNTQWPGGLQAQFTIGNCGAGTVTGWTVTVWFSGSVAIQAWNARPDAGTRTVHFGPEFYDSAIAPGRTVTFGFNATWSGGAPRAITGCALANGSCS